jgi:hypothetical protein
MAIRITPFTNPDAPFPSHIQPRVFDCFRCHDPSITVSKIQGIGRALNNASPTLDAFFRVDDRYLMAAAIHGQNILGTHRDALSFACAKFGIQGYVGRVHECVDHRTVPGRRPLKIDGQYGKSANNEAKANKQRILGQFPK